MKELLGLLTVFFVITFIINWWKVLLGIIALAGITYAAYAAFAGWWKLCSEQRHQEAARIEQLHDNANAQHHSYMQGFDHGVYGNYPPIDLDKL